MIKKICTDGIFYLEPLDGSDAWYWGSDRCHGDLFEAEELFRQGLPIKSNRLIFVRYPDGMVLEPVTGTDGQYFGPPLFLGGNICILLVDFKKSLIRVLQYDGYLGSIKEAASMPLAEADDCYNLLLHGSPLMVTRQGPENDFQMIWPDKCRFAIGDTETFCFRDGDRLYFTRWTEEPDYREETVVRQYPDGRIIETFAGNIVNMPGGHKWLLV